MWLTVSNMVPNNPHFLVFTPFCNPFHLSGGWTQ